MPGRNPAATRPLLDCNICYSHIQQMFPMTKWRPDRNVTVLAASLFGLALGEELWLAYLPAYLAALGASGLAVGLFGSCRDLLDSVYQYPGGWLADRVGRR